MKQSHIILTICLVLISILHSQPTVSEVIKFDSHIQDEPRIKFSKGVEESVAPTSGALTVSYTALGLSGRGMPVKITHKYNSSSVPPIIEEEIGRKSFSKIATISGIGGFTKNGDFYGGTFHTQFGLESGKAIFSEALVKDIIYGVVLIVGKILEKAIGPKAVDTIVAVIEKLLEVINVDKRDNNNLRTYVPPMTPSVGEVKGLIGSSRKVISAGDVASFVLRFADIGTSSADDLKGILSNFMLILNAGRDIEGLVGLDKVIDQPIVVMADGSTVGFKKDEDERGDRSEYSFYIKQPDMHGQYNLVAREDTDGTFNYYFQMKDGVIHKMEYYPHFFIYFGADFNLKDVIETFKSAKKEKSDETTKTNENQSAGLDSEEVDFMQQIAGAFGDVFQINCIPYAVVTEIIDPSSNVIKIDYETSRSGQEREPRRIDKVTDSLGREIDFVYNSWDFADAAKPFYNLKHIVRPDGEKIQYSYTGGSGGVCPETMTIADPEGRKTVFHFRKKGDNDGKNGFIVGDDLPYYYLNKIQYPTGGYVYYDIRPYSTEDSFFFKDRNLAEEIVWKRQEHTSIDSKRDVVETTTFDYHFDVSKDKLITTQISFDVFSIGSQIAKIIRKKITVEDVLDSIQGGVYIRHVKEVRGGTVTVKDASGKTTKYTLKKSNPGNYNHYTASINLMSGLWLFDYMLDFDGWQLGYKPSRTLLTDISETGPDIETTTTKNTYNNKWYLIRKNIFQGSVASEYRYEYDEWANVKKESGPLGRLTLNEYGLNTDDNYVNRKYLKFMPGLLTKTSSRNVIPGGETYYTTTEHTYDLDGIYRGRVHKTVQNKGTDEEITTTNSFDKYGEITSSCDPMDNIIRYENIYNGTNIIRRQTAYNGKISEDSSTVQPETIVTISTQDYDTEFLLSETDPKGNTTLYANDLIGRVTNVTFPDDTIVTYDYHDSYSDLVKDWIYVDVRDQEQINMDDGEHFLRYGYDGLGRLKYLEQHFKEDGKKTVYTNENFYNPDGTLAKVRDAEGRETELSYDASKRLTEIQYPDKTKRRTVYNYSIDTDRFVQSLVDANTNMTRYFFDILGRLIKVEESGVASNEGGVPISPLTVYTYDTFGNILSFKDASFNTTSYMYDKLNRLTNEKYPDNTQFTYEYNLNNNVTRKLDPRGVETLYKYDNLKRLTNITALGEIQGFFVFDKLGNRTFSSNDAVHAEYAYNERNWLTSETKTIGESKFTFIYIYNQTGDLLRNIYPSGYTLLNTIDTFHRVKDVKYLSADSSVPLPVSSYSFNPMGTVSQIKFGNGVTQDFFYDIRDRVSKFIIHKSDTDKPLLWKRYSYDPVGNRIQDNTYEKDTPVSQYMSKKNINHESLLGYITRYSYDNLYRLTGVHYPGIRPNKDDDQEFQYDSVGNRLEHKYELGHHMFTYNSLNQLTLLTNFTRGGTIRYSYDRNGNLTNEFKSRGGMNIFNKTFFWDYNDRLRRIEIQRLEGLSTNQTNAVLEFEYDTEGNRTRKSVYYNNELRRQRVYISGREEYDKDDLLENIYIRELRILSNGNVEFNHKDSLGSTVLITDPSGNKIERNEYDPFGSIEKQKTTTDNDKLFTGKEMDFETGLQYFGARYYDSLTGRWVSRDPVLGDIYKPQSLNRYLYVHNNPLTYVDIQGKYRFKKEYNNEVKLYKTRVLTSRLLYIDGTVIFNFPGGRNKDGKIDWVLPKFQIIGKAGAYQAQIEDEGFEVGLDLITLESSREVGAETSQKKGIPNAGAKIQNKLMLNLFEISGAIKGKFGKLGGNFGYGAGKENTLSGNTSEGLKFKAGAKKGAGGGVDIQLNLKNMMKKKKYTPQGGIENIGIDG